MALFGNWYRCLAIFIPSVLAAEIRAIGSFSFLFVLLALFFIGATATATTTLITKFMELKHLINL